MSSEIINVVKRDGTQEPLNLDKIHNMLYKACSGLTGVSVSDIALKARLSFYNGITTKEIHTALIKSAADLISEIGVNYQYVSGNLLNYDLRKTAWGGMEPTRLYDHVVKMTENGYYTSELLEFYSETEWDKMDAFIDHDRDFKMTYIGLNEYITKYAMRDRSASELTPLETPQITYMLIAALSAFETRNLKDVKSFYNDFSQWNVSLPTPIMAGLRSPTKQFSSCTLISAGDSLDSLAKANEAIMKYAAKKAGIGIDLSRVRAEGAPVGQEKAIKHTGVIPFLRAAEGSLKSCSQGGVRGASATATLCLWHLEVADLLVLKNNKGTPDNRVRKLDYSFQINNYLYNRLIDGGAITLFSPSEKETPGLYDAFFSDSNKFAELYEKYEADPTIRKKSITSIELFAKFVTERKETSRIYVFNVDNVNLYSTFKKSITTSNLCQEITLVTVPMGTHLTESNPVTFAELPTLLDTTTKIHNVVNVKTENFDAVNQTLDLVVTKDISEIALCTLAAINLGNTKSLDDLEGICRNAVRSLDALLSYQDYMVTAARTSTEKYRPLGIGITNLAYYLAKNSLKYNEQGAYDLMHDTMEAISFYCIKASIELAKEKGRCPGFEDTKWADGLLPIHRYHKNVDKITNPRLKLDWKWLGEQLAKYGIRNATLLALMPAESSSRIFNSTNGAEPVRALITTKGNKAHVSAQVVPEFSRLKNKYDPLWEMRDMDGVIKLMAVIQKFTCQSISTNLSYNPEHYPKGEIPLSILVGDLLKANYYGIKTLYYHNGRDASDDTKVEDAKEIEVVPETSEAEQCDACSI
ncbi:ribonucleotide diphosphate reductase alpha subunit [Xanthomonas phage Xoo-sp13]|nr:ribonucleotide diphosphate reductase alpha subunit [Xanthomonas phage Xoo-sp13]